MMLPIKSNIRINPLSARNYLLSSGVEDKFLTLKQRKTCKKSCSLHRPQLHDTGLLSDRHEILPFHGEFSIQNYDNITKLINNSKDEKF